MRILHKTLQQIKCLFCSETKRRKREILTCRIRTLTPPLVTTESPQYPCGLMDEPESPAQMRPAQAGAAGWRPPVSHVPNQHMALESKHTNAFLPSAPRPEQQTAR